MLKKIFHSFFKEHTSILFFPRSGFDCGVSLIIPFFKYDSSNCLVVDETVFEFKEIPTKNFTINANSVILFAHPNHFRNAFYSQNGDITPSWFTKNSNITSYRNVFAFSCFGEEVLKSSNTWSEVFLNWATFKTEILLKFSSDLDKKIFIKLIREVSKKMSLLEKDDKLHNAINSCYDKIIEDYISMISRNKKEYNWAFILSIQDQLTNITYNHG